MEDTDIPSSSGVDQHAAEGPLEELAHLAGGLQPGPAKEEPSYDPVDDYEEVGIHFGQSINCGPPLLVTECCD